MGGKRDWLVRKREKTFRRFVERAYFRVLMTGKMAWDELSFRQPIPLSRRVGYLRRGFGTKSALIYGLNSGNADLFLPDTAWPRMMHLNGSFGCVLNNKLLFHQVLQAYREHLPENHALILEGRLFPLKGSGAGPELDVPRYLEERLPAVLKPVGGSASKGICFLSKRAGGIYLNDEPVSSGDLKALVEKFHEYLVCGHVEQHPVLAGMYPHATATVKVLSVRDVDSGEPFIPHACVRVGTDDSRPFDALTRGGLTSRIWIEDGRLGKARGLYTPEEQGRESHPDTGARIEGVLLPHWGLIRSKLIEMCRAFPYLNYLIWDLAVTAEGFRILEGNNHPGLTLIQMHCPLLEDPRLRAFYAHHGVVGH